MSTARSLAVLPTETINETPFYIAAGTGIGSRPRCSLKYDDTFLVVDSHGDIGTAEGGPDGLFHSDTRFLSRLAMTVNDLQPLLLGFNARDDNTVQTVDLTNPDIFLDEKIVLQKDTLHIVRTTFIWRKTAYQRVGIRNHGIHPVGLRIAFRFDNDFADVFEVRGLKRKRRGLATREVTDGHQVILRYQGLDGVIRRSALSFDPPPAEIAGDKALYHFVLGPGDLGRRRIK